MDRGPLDYANSTTPPPSTTLPVLAAGIPDDLIKRRQWVAWRFEWIEDARTEAGGRWTKVPINVSTGGRASSTDSTTWSSFDDALAFAEDQMLSGVGYVFAADDPYCGIDLDKCIDEDGNLAEWAAETVGD